MKRAIFILIIAGLFSCKTGTKESKTNGQEEVRQQLISNAEPSEEEVLFRRHCGTCHQLDGGGVPGMYPPLAGNAVLKDDNEKLIAIVLEGVLQSSDKNKEFYIGEMPPQNYLSDEEISKILTFIRTEFSDSQDSIMAFEVTALREKLNL